MEALADEAPACRLEDLLAAEFPMGFGDTWHEASVKRTFVLDNYTTASHAVVR
jgi:hypothetical protein